jgi:isoleucyl-tRNA synthetase
LYNQLATLGDELRFVMMTSRCELVEHGDDSLPMTAIVKPSEEHKCERCWHYVPGVGEDAEHAGLCPRCRENLFGQGETRRFA